VTHDPDLKVRTIATLIPVSTEDAMDLGLIPDTRPPAVCTRRQRLRWAVWNGVRRLRLRLGSWIAGQDLDPDGYDDL
jgi:hypothetical protein